MRPMCVRGPSRGRPCGAITKEGGYACHSRQWTCGANSIEDDLRSDLMKRKEASFESYGSKILDNPTSARYAYIAGRDAHGASAQQPVVTQEEDYAVSVKEAVRAAYAVVRSDGSVFSLEPKRGGLSIKPNMQGEALLRALQIPFEDIEATLPRHYFNPFFTLLRQCRDAHVPDAVLLAHWKVLREADARSLLDLLNEVVRELRERWMGKELKKSLDSARRRSDKRWQSVKQAIHESFQDCSKLLAIRLDLHFHMSTELYPLAPAVSEEQMSAYLVKFERYLRDRLPLVRYVCSIEYGTQTGFHLHFLILLNGHLARDGIGVAKATGEHWKNVITQGQGRYFNCNANDYKTPVLGMIHANDPQRIDALINKAAWYLAKTDFWMRYEAAGKGLVKSIRYRKPHRGGAKRKADQIVHTAPVFDRVGAATARDSVGA
ncbi:MAG: inovirus Gp2 family protein [Variovorax sp.]|nr:MAG: inovirus Gp2 family protein [Variovorax sp.]